MSCAMHEPLAGLPPPPAAALVDVSPRPAAASEPEGEHQPPSSATPAAGAQKPRHVRHDSGTGDIHDVITSNNVVAAGPEMRVCPPYPIDTDSYPEYAYSTTTDYVAACGFGIGFPIRRHTRGDLWDAGSLEARADWERWVAPLGPHTYAAINHNSGHLGELCLPMARPERCAILAYCFEYVFLHDFVTDTAPIQQTLDVNDDVLGMVNSFLPLDEPKAFFAALDAAEQDPRPMSGRRRIQLKIMRQLAELDFVASLDVLTTFATFLRVGAGREKLTAFDSLESYVDYRVIDSGLEWGAALIRFGHACHLTPEESRVAAPVEKAWNAAASLANDVVSFDVELTAARAAGADNMTNAVWHLRRWEGLEGEAAQCRLGEHVVRYEQEYLRLWEKLRQDGGMTPEVEKYLVALSFQIGGMAVWGETTPKYNLQLREEED